VKRSTKQCRDKVGGTKSLDVQLRENVESRMPHKIKFEESLTRLKRTATPQQLQGLGTNATGTNMTNFGSIDGYKCQQLYERPYVFGNGDVFVICPMSFYPNSSFALGAGEYLAIGETLSWGTSDKFWKSLISQQLRFKSY